MRASVLQCVYACLYSHTPVRTRANAWESVRVCVLGCARARDCACTCMCLQAWARARASVHTCPCLTVRAQACVLAKTPTCTWKSVNAHCCDLTCPSRHLNICTHASPARVRPPALQSNHSPVVLVPTSLCHRIPLLGVVAPRPRAPTEFDKSE